MKNPVIYIRQLLSVRLSLWIVLFATLIFMGALGYLFHESRETVREEAINRANQILDNTELRVNSILDQVEIATRNIMWLPTRHLDAPDSMYVYSRRILENNPDLFGCSISFEPYYFKDRGQYFSVYSKYSNTEEGVIESLQEGNDDYQYFCMDWYLLPKLLDGPCWTEPYTDTYVKEMIISYGIPLKDKEDKFVGVISTDISLSWLSNVITSIKPYPNSYSIMTGRGGTFLVHPDSTKLFYETIFTETLETPDTAMTALGHAMHAGEAGMKQMTIDGEDCFVFYKPLKKTQWSVAIVCPEDDIFGGFDRLTRAVSVIVMIGLLLMLYIVSRIITRELRPLRKLANQTRVIASGHFEQNLSDEGRIDEIGNLAKSFGDMQHSLVSYIDELKDATAAKERFESELRIARDIQMSMVPSHFPQYEGLDMYAEMSPAREVGGDLYGYVLQDDRLHFCLGDVSGKGVPASLFMSQSARLFRTLATEGMTPVDIAMRMNNELAENNEKGMFVTMFIGMLHLDTGRLDFCNCGHNAPIIDGKFLEFKVNPPLGLWEDDPYEGDTIDDIRGKQLLIYTDGLNEAENTDQELLGNQRLLELMADTASLSSRQVIDMLKEAVEAHRNGAAEAIALARENNPKYLESRQATAEARREAEKAKVEKNLSVSLDASIGLNQVADRFADAYRHLLSQDMATVKLTIPLKDWGKRKNAYLAARSSVDMAERTEQETARDVELDVALTVAEFNERQTIVENARQALTIAEDAYAQTLQQFIRAQADAYSLSVAQSHWQTARQNHITSLQNYWLAYYHLRRLTLYDYQRHQLVNPKHRKDR